MATTWEMVAICMEDAVRAEDLVRELAFRRELRIDPQRALAAFERRLLLGAAESWLPSHADAARATELAPGAKVRYVPNVVDVAALRERRVHGEVDADAGRRDHVGRDAVDANHPIPQLQRQALREVGYGRLHRRDVGGPGPEVTGQRDQRGYQYRCSLKGSASSW